WWALFWLRLVECAYPSGEHGRNIIPGNQLKCEVVHASGEFSAGSIAATTRLFKPTQILAISEPGLPLWPAGQRQIARSRGKWRSKRAALAAPNGEARCFACTKAYHSLIVRRT